MRLNVPERWLAVCRSLDKLAHGIAATVPPSIVDGTNSHRQKICSYSLLVRTMSNFRATIVMVSEGMRIEALTLARSAIESAIYLNVLANDMKFLDELEQDDQKSREGVLQAGIDLLRHLQAEPNLADELSQEMASLKAKGKKDRIEVKDLATRINRPELYALYKHLSSSAAHPSKTAIYMGFRFDPDGGVTLGEIKEGGHDLMVDTALFCACSALLCACTEVNNLGNKLPLDAKLAELAAQIVAVKA